MQKEPLTEMPHLRYFSVSFKEKLIICRYLFLYSAIHGSSFIRDLCTTYYKRAIIFVKSTQHYEKIVKIHFPYVNLT